MWSFVLINLQGKLGIFCFPFMKSSRWSHGMTVISTLLYSPWPLVTWGSHIISNIWKGPRGGGYCIVAFNVCSKFAYLEGMKGVSSKVSWIPPSSKTTLYSGLAITKFEPHFFGQHKLTKNSNVTSKMKKSNMQIRCRNRIGSGF